MQHGVWTAALINYNEQPQLSEGVFTNDLSKLTDIPWEGRQSNQLIVTEPGWVTFPSSIKEKDKM